uniref:DUF6535 domain-containing protein n=1 Tax=Psilocybe cubensis TaxID=181762 RepID=A0A8H7Y1Z1_PSICU
MQAGLFSATVTSFTVESYQWLQQQPEDEMVQILSHMSAQLKNIQNSSAIPPYAVTQFSVSPSDVRINILWFSSLIEFGRDAARSHKDAIAIRQMRYEGLYKWKVPMILSLLPLLLQLSLVLFFAGVLELLWARNRAVAICITVVVGLVFLVLVLTTVLPALQSRFTMDPFLKVGQCPYKSPQSWAFYRMTLSISRLYKFTVTCSAKLVLCIRNNVHAKAIDPEEEPHDSEPMSSVGLSHFNRVASEDLDRNWCDYDVRWRLMRDATFLDEDTGEPAEFQDGDDIIHGLKWIDQMFSEDLDSVYYVFHCLLDLGSAQAAQLVGELDEEVAYLPRLLFPTDSRPSLYADSPISDFQVREHIFVVFLWLHRHIHPSLHEPYLECTIRLMNSSSQCVPRLALRQCDNDLQGVSRETVYQLFTSLKLVVSRCSITEEQGSDIWAFLRDIYSSHPTLDDPIIPLTFDIFEQFQIWLRPIHRVPFGTHYRNRVETCAVGLTRVFASTNGDSLETLRQLTFFHKLEKLVLDLNTIIPSLLSKSAILRGLSKRRWPDLISRLCVANLQQEESSLLVSVSPPRTPLNQEILYPLPGVDAVLSRLEAMETAFIVPEHLTHEVVQSGAFVTDPN